jgi:hypothetical protein
VTPVRKGWRDVSRKLEGEFNVLNTQQGQPKAPPGTKNVIVFDTNGYRELAHGLTLPEARRRALALRELEKKAGVFALSSPMVIWELVTHLAEKSDPAYMDCLSALAALAEHTWSRRDPDDGLCLLPDGESTICYALFGVVPDNAEQNLRHLSSLAAEIKLHAPAISLAAQHNIVNFAKAMKQSEEQWISSMKTVLNGCHPRAAAVWFGGRSDKAVLARLCQYFGSPAFKSAWAQVTVIDHARSVGKTLSPGELAAKSRFVQEAFPVPFHLTASLLQKIAVSKPLKLDSRKKRRWNFICDVSISFAIGPSHRIDGANVHLVSGDRAIVTAAVAGGCGDRITSLAEYMKSMGMT